MLIALFTSAGCIVLFLWVLAPLFGQPEPLSEPDVRREAEEGIAASLREFQADVDLGKLQPEDLGRIESDLRSPPDGRKG